MMRFTYLRILPTDFRDYISRSYRDGWTNRGKIIKNMVQYW